VHPHQAPEIETPEGLGARDAGPDAGANGGVLVPGLKGGGLACREHRRRTAVLAVFARPVVVDLVVVE
jgi:hypothetical protein